MYLLFRTRLKIYVRTVSEKEPPRRKPSPKTRKLYLKPSYPDRLGLLTHQCPGAMMRTLAGSLIRLLALASSCIAVSSRDANAGFISQADFANPVIYDLSNLGPLANYATPFIVGPFSFTSDDGQIRYTSLGISTAPGTTTR